MNSKNPLGLKSKEALSDKSMEVKVVIEVGFEDINATIEALREGLRTLRDYGAVYRADAFPVSDVVDLKNVDMNY